MEVPKWLEYEGGDITLDDEFDILYHYVEPNPIEYEIRRYVLEKYTRVIENDKKSEIKVVPFGSTQSKLFLPSSDIDFTVVTKGGKTNMVLNSVARILSLYTMEDEKRALRATVPVIKLTDRETGIVLDISHNNESGVDTVRWMEKEMKSNALIRPLLFIIKTVLSSYELNLPALGGLGTYSLFMMVFCFFREKGSDLKDKRGGAILLRFLKYYATEFDSRKFGLSVTGNFSREERHWDASLQNLSIEDPCDTSNDVSISSYKWPYIKFIFKMSYAALFFTNKKTYNKKSSLLGRILTLSDDFCEKRINWIKYWNKKRKDNNSFNNGFLEINVNSKTKEIVCIDDDSVNEKEQKVEVQTSENQLEISKKVELQTIDKEINHQSTEEVKDNKQNKANAMETETNMPPQCEEKEVEKVIETTTQKCETQTPVVSPTTTPKEKNDGQIETRQDDKIKEQKEQLQEQTDITPVKPQTETL
ncbi:PAP-associated domain containing protein, putative [Entamoeba invadens IP1]|uniref:PAP-associated domain containing protein, putative n=1 Tax=Entamoeba invadens IP1 TaxID=370355 RepID=A0A0A1U158_ENTIV|nr:PAP-associated domain containing protein, putative [Entamoeba invadens IP1]ELP84643.1 PAP-associated domain containing protein, putative [Entamoeba invadens IP1]|eukprot:XP_004183989.1 PAP-associated domain containing protein, putative [Entamoeba invadens IP1]